MNGWETRVLVLMSHHLSTLDSPAPGIIILLANQFMQILPEPYVIIVLTPDISRPAGSHCHVLTNLSFPQNILLFPAPN